jgi:hypothetical protein
VSETRLPPRDDRVAKKSKSEPPAASVSQFQIRNSADASVKSGTSKSLGSHGRIVVQQSSGGQHQRR